MSDSVNQPFYLVGPKDYNAEQLQFIEKIKETITIISAQTDLILGATDVNSRELVFTDACSKLLEITGGSSAAEICAGTTSRNDRISKGHEALPEDQALLQQGDINKKISTLHMHHYRGGIHVLAYDKQLLKHVSTRSVLGIFFSAREIELHNFFTVIPNFILEFGSGVSIEKYLGPLKLCDVKFSEYEHEVCYLLTMNWTPRQIADFLNRFRPKAVPRGVDAIYKCRNRICDKLGISNCSNDNLRGQLIDMGLHRKMPQSFFNCILESQSKILDIRNPD